MSNPGKDLAILVDETIDNSAGKFAAMLTQYQWELLPDSQLHAAKQALTRTDYIMKVACGDPNAVHDALIKSAILGLDLTEGKRQGWLLPRKSQKKGRDGKYLTVIQLQVGYKGVEAIHQRMGVIDRLSIRVIRENDPFEWSGDDQEKPDHKASWLASEETRGPISGAFAITYYPDKSINVIVIPISEIFEKHRDRSDSWKSYQTKLKEKKNPYPPPWLTDEKSMVEKTMAYIASKQWPANIRDNKASSKILETLHEIDTSDYTYQYTLEQKEAFNDFLESGDSLGLCLFSYRVGIECFSAISTTLKKNIERGGKGEYQDKISGMLNQGSDIYSAIIVSIEKNDPALLGESLEGCLEITHKLVKARLDPHQKAIFDELSVKKSLPSPTEGEPTIEDAFKALRENDKDLALDIAASLGNTELMEIQNAIDSMDEKIGKEL